MDRDWLLSQAYYVSAGEHFARRYICGTAAEPRMTLKVVRSEGAKGSVDYVSQCETFAGSFGRQT